jgi:hypothetical protein
MIEVIVDQQAVRHDAAFGNRRQRDIEVGRLDDVAAPAVQQGFHAVEYRGLVVDAERGGARELAGVDAGGVARR